MKFLALWLSFGRIQGPRVCMFVVRGSSFSRTQPDLEGFLRALRFPPSSKSNPSLIHLAVDPYVPSRSYMHSLTGHTCTASSVRAR